MALSKQPYKGARDFYPPDKRLQKYVFAMWREVCERFGYEEYDAPILEPLEIYLAKTGEEIVKEQTYTFEDRGEPPSGYPAGNDAYRQPHGRSPASGVGLSAALVQHPEPLALRAGAAGPLA